MNHTGGPQDRFAPLEAVRGETYMGTVVVYQGDGITPVNLTGLTVTFTIRKPGGAEIEGNVTAEPTEGTINIHIPTETMTELEPVAYPYQLWADNGEGVRRLVLWGYFWVRCG